MAILIFVLTVALVTAATLIAAGRPPRSRRRETIHRHRPQRQPLPPPPPSPDDDAEFIARLAQRRQPPA